MFPGTALAVEAIGITRTLSNGATDTTFGTSGITDVAFGTDYNWPTAAVVQSDDKIVVVGRFDNPQNGITNTGIVRLNANGSLDTTFGQGGKILFLLTNSAGAISTGPTAVMVQSDGKILVAAGAAGHPGALTAFLRYNPNGTLDYTFGQEGIALVNVYGGSPGILAELTTGDLLTVGGSVIAQYGPSGALRSQVTGGTRWVTSSALAGLPDLIEPAGTVLLGTSVGEVYASHVSFNQLIRFLSTGGVDWTFSNAPFPGLIDAAVQTDDYRIVVAASAPALNDINLLRFNTDGSVDTTFGNGGTVSTPVAGGSALPSLVTMQPDGRILVIGIYTPAGGTGVLMLARYLHQAH